jgi:Ca-activated chloride channel homolog
MNENLSDSLEKILNTPYNVFADEFSLILHNLHFIRADWFYAFIPLLLYLLLYSLRKYDARNWQPVIDDKLLPFVLTKTAGKQRRYPLLLTFIAASLCITALAGPVYKKLPQPVYREQSSLVVLLDLSSSMNATDIKPSRLARAKLELLDILDTRKTGQTALIVYAADAFVVTPLTEDNATIANLVPALETSMMPAQGSNLSKALAKTVSLFSQAGVIKGDILVITDDIHASDQAAIEKVQSQGHRLSVFAIGTTAGAPIPLTDSETGGFLKDASGSIVIPKLQRDKLQKDALLGGGIYTEVQADDSDTRRLTQLFESSQLAETTEEDQDLNADIWQEEGHWLLLPLLLFAGLWARKGWIAAMLPFIVSFLIAAPQPGYADTKPHATATPVDTTTPASKERPYLDTDNLWSSPDQKAMKAFAAGDTKSAAQQFTHPGWKASALYRAGDFEAAAKTLENANTSDGLYNKANALARLGKLQQAIEAYDSALALDENNKDAAYNREQVKKALEKQQQEQSSQNKSDQDKSEQKDSGEQQEQSDQQQSQQQSQQQQQEMNADSEKQGDEQQQGKQEDKGSSKQDKQQQQDEQQSASNPETEPEQQPGQQPEQQPEEQNSEQQDQDRQQAEEKQLKQRDADAEKKQQQAENQQYQKNQQQQDEQDKSDQKQSDSVEHKEAETEEDKSKQQEVEVNPVEASITEEEKATEQWLRRIPDDPGGLLRRKFLYQYKQAPNQHNNEEPW